MVVPSAFSQSRGDFPAKVNRRLSACLLACLTALPALLLGISRAEAKPLHGTQAQVRRLSVIDYFNLLPCYGIGDSTTPKQRRELLQFGTDPNTNPVIDLRHDYLLIHPDSSPAEQITVFRAPGKSDLVAVSMPDSENDYNYFALYRLRKGKLRDVTRQMLPMPLRIDNFLYVLPENGTTIRVFKFNIGDNQAATLLTCNGAEAALSSGKRTCATHCFYETHYRYCP